MSVRTFKTLVEQLLSEAGITVNGDRPFDLQVHDDRFYGRFLGDGTLGLGESYMDGWWDCEQLDEMMARFARAGLSRKFSGSPRFVLNTLRARVANGLQGDHFHRDHRGPGIHRSRSDGQQTRNEV